MRPLLLTASLLIASLSAIHPAHAQKDIISLFYKLRLAPIVCHWAHAGDSRKLAHTIEVMEDAYAITPTERAELLTAAETELKSDPSSCAATGVIRPMYDGAIR